MYSTTSLIVAVNAALLTILGFALQHWLSRLERKIDLMTDNHADVDRRVSRLEGARIR